MNDDRISEVYRGEIWAEPAQDRARRRINWMCSSAIGDKVLDIGTSQGIAAILLGREGFTVTGVDIQPDRIDTRLQTWPKRLKVPSSASDLWWLKGLSCRLKTTVSIPFCWAK